jgi:hypothetical protein
MIVSRVLRRAVSPGAGAWRLLLAPVVLLCAAQPVWAHAGHQGFVLLLPTEYYIAGGTLAVAASFLVLLLVPAATVHRIAAGRAELCRVPRISTTATSLVTFVLLILLLLAGLSGSRDPLANPLPLAVWTLWWVGLAIAQALIGDLWAALNPWLAPYRLLRRLDGRSTADDRPPLAYPAWLGYWPAVVGFLGFAWFELVDPAPDDPARLAVAAAAYSAVTLAGMLLFGERAWLGKAECFSVFFGFVARLAPFHVECADGRGRLVLTFPGAALTRTDALPVSGMLLVLLTLATVSFDGLNKTFWWLDLGGINPLEYPGRTAVMSRNSLGLVGMWAALGLAYGLAIALGCRLAGGRIGVKDALGAFVLSILPISIGYHFAHYLTAFMVNGQYALLAFSDPFALGWDLLGTGGRQVTASFLSNYESVSIIWKLQAAGVVAGHLLAVSLAHLIVVERFGSTRAALASQLPLAVLMVGYTLFGLWLLAAPTAG